MAPGSRRVQDNASAAVNPSNVASAQDDLFLEPMMGTPLALYIEKDVEDREELVSMVIVSYHIRCMGGGSHSKIQQCISLCISTASPLSMNQIHC